MSGHKKGLLNQMIMLVCMHAKSREHSKLQSQGQKKKKEEVQKKKKLGKQITHSFHRPLMI